MMSAKTKGSSEYSRMPASELAAAALNAAFIASTSASLLSSAVKSVNEPSGVGTRMAKPSSLPSSSGSTLPTAAAAPVVVGTIDAAAERARRISLCGASSRRWSPVYE